MNGWATEARCPRSHNCRSVAHRMVNVLTKCASHNHIVITLTNMHPVQLICGYDPDFWNLTPKAEVACLEVESRVCAIRRKANCCYRFDTALSVLSASAFSTSTSLLFISSARLSFRPRRRPFAENTIQGPNFEELKTTIFPPPHKTAPWTLRLSITHHCAQFWNFQIFYTKNILFTLHSLMYASALRMLRAD